MTDTKKLLGETLGALQAIKALVSYSIALAHKDNEDAVDELTSVFDGLSEIISDVIAGVAHENSVDTSGLLNDMTAGAGSAIGSVKTQTLGMIRELRGDHDGPESL